MAPSLFPLTPFLLSLSGIGIGLTLDDLRRIQQLLSAHDHWTHQHLQQVLVAVLAKDARQQQDMERLYLRFRQAGDTAAVQAVDVAALKRDLQALLKGGGQGGQPFRGQAAAPPIPGETRLKPWFVPLLLLLFCVAFWGFYWLLSGDKPPEPGNTAPPAAVMAPAALETSQDTVTVKQGVVEEKIPPTPPFSKGGTNAAVWWWLVVLASAGGTLLLWRRLRQSQRMPDVPAALVWDQDGEVYFNPADIGGEMPPWLDGQVLDDCADSIGFFTSEEQGRGELDVPATIRATAQAAGLPEVRMQARRDLLCILVLVDMRSPGQRWQPLAFELAQGLRQRGLPVILGHLHGSLRQFRTDDGERLRLDELAEERGRYITLVFADARMADWKHERRLLEELARWPQLVWLTSREPRFWNGREQYLQATGIRLRVADPADFTVIFQELAGEGITARPRPAGYQRFMPQAQGEPLAAYVQRLLGDALPLARVVAVLPPPVSPALLVRILREFFPQLPLTRLQRLYALPDTRSSSAGLHWDGGVLGLLRGQFHRWVQGEQKQRVRDRLLAWYQAASPEENPPQSPFFKGGGKKTGLQTGFPPLKKGGQGGFSSSGRSLRYYHWYWRYLRLLLEFEPEAALPEMERLQTLMPLQGAIGKDLQQTGVAIAPPQDDASRKRLWKLSGGKAISEALVWPQLPSRRREFVGGVVLTALLAVVAVGQQWSGAIADAWNQMAGDPPLPVTAVQQETPPSLPLSGEGQTVLLPKMVEIPAGSFQMGCVEGKDCQDDEKPVHAVSVPAFEMGVYEVTNAEYVAFLNAVGRRGTKEQPWFETKAEDSTSRILEAGGTYRVEQGYEQHPAINISWFGAKAYLDWLEQQTQPSGKGGWRLPTEAEWEYATRAGTTTAYSWGDQEPVCDTTAPNGAQFGSCKERAPLKVGSFKPNPYGLYDVHGNVWEWVEDCWRNNYENAPLDGSALADCDAAASRVLRGGSWFDIPRRLRSAYRGGNSPDFRDYDVGFRAARTN